MFVLGFCLDEPGTGGTVLFRGHGCGGGGGRSTLFVSPDTIIFPKCIKTTFFAHFFFNPVYFQGESVWTGWEQFFPRMSW